MPVADLSLSHGVMAADPGLGRQGGEEGGGQGGLPGAGRERGGVRGGLREGGGSTGLGRKTSGDVFVRNTYFCV